MIEGSADLILPEVAAEAAAWLAACPMATVLVDPTAEKFSVIGANAEALALFDLPGGAPRDLAVIAECLDDPREPLLTNRVREVAKARSSGNLKVLARRRVSGDRVLLEARIAAVGAGVALFLREARARGTAGTLPVGRVQEAIFAISRATHEASSLAALFERIHGIVERLIDAKNFYIALVDEAEQMLRFAYSRDEFDAHRPDRRLGLGVTDLVYLTGQPLLLDRATADRMLEAGQVINHGVPAQVWLGVPLNVAGKTVGVMAVQDYHNPHFLGEPERQLLSYISDQIANAIAIKRAGEAAEEARAEAKRAGQVKADFIATMSHELRTPLAVVIGFGELLQESLAGRPEAKQATSIVQSGQRLLEAVNQMLDYSKADGQAQPVREENVRVEELLRDTAAAFAEHAAERGITFTRRQYGYVPETLHTDAQIVRRVLTNLLHNAVQFTPPGGQVVLAVRAEPAAPFHENRQRFVFSIEDTGVGIPPDKLGKLFQPFEETGRPVKGEGVGLGLAISQRLAALVGGRLTVRSSPGEGSVFSLTLVAEAESDEPMGDVAERLGLLLRSQIESRGGAWRVLVVDPEEEGRAVMSGLIASLTGRPPATAASAEEMAAALETIAPTVVLVHECAPRLDGPAVCVALRARTARVGGAREFLVVYSVDHSAARVQACLSAGADDYLPKPVSRLSLVQTLSAAFEAMGR